jgi:U3 small nucleolar RNA-associated protein 13
LSSSCVACFKEHLSLPTSISFNPKGTLFVSGSRDKVLNFYSLEKLEHIKTIAVMEEIEGVQILKDEHSSQILKINSKSNKAKDSKVQNGIVKIYKIEMTGKDKSTFAYELLLQIPLSNFANVGQSNSISTLLYLPVTGEIIAATADYNFNSYTIDSISSIYNGTDDNKSRVIANRQIVGCNDDILDITFIPRYTNNDDEDDDCNKNSNEFTLAMATNSPLVRLMDESFSCSLLDGHTDIVLSVDASPNG